MMLSCIADMCRILLQSPADDDVSFVEPLYVFQPLFLMSML